MIISTLYKTGIRVATVSLQCLVLKTKDIQFAVIVGKKVQKSAVKRNRMKRIVRAALTSFLPTLTSPIHCLVIVKKDCSMKKTADIVKELNIVKTV